MNTTPDRIFDPASPNWHGYQLYRFEPTLAQFIALKWTQAVGNLAWSLYGRNEIVAWYLHREQTALGRIKNSLARVTLNYLYGSAK